MTGGRTLIIGGGFSGMTTALDLAAEGLPSLLVEREQQLGGLLRLLPEQSELLHETIAAVEKQTLIEVCTGMEPARIRGVYPDFLVTLSTPEGRRSEHVENIVFATGLEPRFPERWPNLAPAPGVMTTLDLLSRRHPAPEEAQPAPLPTGRAMLVLGFQEHTYGFSIATGLRLALELRQGGRDVCVVLDNVRFADAWTPLLYRSCREAGVVFFKCDTPPDLAIDDQGIVRFSLLDPGLQGPGGPAVVRGAVALLLLEPEYLPRAFPELFWSPQRLDQDPAGFYGASNLHLYPVHSGRAGIYLVGAVTGLKDLDRCRREAGLAVSHILTPGEERPKAVVDEGKCAACLTCVRLCPHHTIVMDRVAQIAAEACFGCGTCVAECPAGAIHLEAPAAEAIPTPAPEPEQQQESPEGRIVVFGCDGSTYRALERAAQNGPITDTPLLVRHLPCNGNLDLVELLSCLHDGASGIYVAACQDHNCRHLQGNRRAARRVARGKEILAELGLPPELLRIGHFASNMERELVRELRAFEKELSSPRQPSTVGHPTTTDAPGEHARPHSP
jgi:coenzyme F420-reducing hydrogenase delta subunit/Pyruvate/2-oxoacid:ferredoxin oxidoreductase delta subunit